MIIEYNESYKNAWDRFVLEESVNGTLLQTRNFLEYHKDRFDDCSIMFMKGNNIVAAIPAHIMIENTVKKFMSHMGSTFGGLIVGKNYLKVDDLDWILDELEDYLKEKGFLEAILKMTSNLYSNRQNDIVEYYLYNHGYSDMAELGYYIDLQGKEEEDIVINFNGSRRRSLKKAMVNNFEIKVLTTEEQIKEFYELLTENMLKFNKTPVHTYEELIDFFSNRLKDEIEFLGIYHEHKMIAGSMIFYFKNKKVYHTQYLVTSQNDLSLFPSEYLYYALILQAKKENYDYISFGTATLENGKVLNRNLARFKEGFGTDTYINRTFRKAW